MADSSPSYRPRCKNLCCKSMLVYGEGFENDPDYRRSTFAGFDSRPGLPMAWATYAISMYDAPVELHYTGLDPRGSYRVRAIYAADTNRVTIRLDADGKEVHPLMQKPDPPEPVEFDIPTATTADGELTLSWYREAGRAGARLAPGGPTPPGTRLPPHWSTLSASRRVQAGKSCLMAQGDVNMRNIRHRVTEMVPTPSLSTPAQLGERHERTCRGR